MPQQLSLSYIDAPFAIRLDFFEGPMDLFLHLVKKQEVSIDDVEMSVIAEQYLEIVTVDIDNIDLDRAAEFLVIAATLMNIKSQSLLPNEINLDELPNYEDGSAFFESLRERIRQYEITKLRAEALAQSPQLGLDVFTRRDTTFIAPDLEKMGEGESPHILGSAFLGLLKRIGSDIKSYKIRLEPVSVVSCMMKILDDLKDRLKSSKGSEENRFSFFKVITVFLNEKSVDLGDLEKAKVSARSLVVGSFMAILELAKRGLLSANQEVDNGEIKISLKMDSDSSLDFSDFEGEDDLVSQDVQVSNDDESILIPKKEEVNRG